MRKTTRRAKTAPATPKQAFLAALEGGRNRNWKETFASFLERGELRQENGRWFFSCPLCEHEKGPALAFANCFDQYEHTNALITHDLHSFTCRDVTAVIEKLRVN